MSSAVGRGAFWVIKKTYYYAIFALLIVLGVSLPFIIRARGGSFTDRFLVAFQGLIIVTIAAWLAAKGTFWAFGKARNRDKGER